jgi:NHL repeat-containing protein
MHKVLKDGSVIHLFGIARQPAFSDSAYASDVTVGIGYPNNMPLVYNKANKSLYVGTDAQIYKLDSTNNLLLLIGGTGAYHNTGDGGDAKKASFVLADFFIDKKQNIILSDNQFGRIRKIDTSGIIKTIAGTRPGFGGDGGSALNAKFNNPQGIAEDKNGNIFIADRYNNRIRRIDVQTNIITTYAGNGDEDYYGDGGPATLAALNQPDDLAFDKKVICI